MRGAHVYAVPSLAIGGVVLATDHIRDTRTGHKVSFVRAVDILFGADDGAAETFVDILQADRLDARALFVGAEDTVSVEHVDTAARDVVVEDVKCDTRFEDPLLEFAVVLSHAAVEIEREALDGLFVAYVGLAETSRRKTAGAVSGFYDDDRLALHGGRVGGDDARRRGPVDADVIFDGVGAAACREQGRKCE